jgi:penicillin-binding protein 2
LRNKRGGIVAIEPEPGEVLSLVSAPSYDPNLLVGRMRSKNYRNLTLDSISKPLFDRGLQAQYAPGSPFKTLNALIALQEGVINSNTTYRCNHGHFYARGMFMDSIVNMEPIITYCPVYSDLVIPILQIFIEK